MPMQQITIYTLVITGTFVIKAKNDAEAIEQAHAWVAEDVRRLNYALTKQDGYEISVTP